MKPTSSLPNSHERLSGWASTRFSCQSATLRIAVRIASGAQSRREVPGPSG